MLPAFGSCSYKRTAEEASACARVSLICQWSLAGHRDHVLKPRAVKEVVLCGRLSKLLTSCVAVNSSHMAK